MAFNQNIGVCDYRTNVPGCSQLITNASMQFQSDVPSSTSNISDLPVPDVPEQQHQSKNLHLNISKYLFFKVINFSQQTNASSLSSRTTSPISSNTAASTDECVDGHHHGDHIKHPEQCSLFFHCVWGRMVTMSCPRGTAFNPLLSVCDYPSRVPNCETS